MKRWGAFVLASVLGAIASAGLIASTTSDLQPFTGLHIGSVWLIPGLMLIGALLATGIGEAALSGGALAVAALLGSVLYGLALSAPGFKVDEVQVQLINRGTTQGLVAFMLIMLFGLAGMMIALLAAMLLGRADM
jgi:hypothetical protein